MQSWTIKFVALTCLSPLYLKSSLDVVATRYIRQKLLNHRGSLSSPSFLIGLYKNRNQRTSPSGTGCITLRMPDISVGTDVGA